MSLSSTLADPAHQLAHVNLGSRQVHVNLAHELLSLILIVLEFRVQLGLEAGIIIIFFCPEDGFALVGALSSRFTIQSP